MEHVSSDPLLAGTPAYDVMLGAGVQSVQSTLLIAHSGDLLGLISTHYRHPGRPPERGLNLITRSRSKQSNVAREKGATEAFPQESNLQPARGIS